MQLVTLNQVYFIFIPCAKQEIIFSQLSKSQKKSLSTSAVVISIFSKDLCTYFSMRKIGTFSGKKKKNALFLDTY